jgi:AraC-like DNA-binding protein
MSLVYETRSSNSPLVETIIQGHTVRDGSSIRPAESHWHLVLVNYQGQTKSIVVGPWTTAGIASWQEGADILWIKFGLGTFMPHLPARKFLDVETTLPGASSRSFWLKGSAWQVPDFDHADVFVERLVREELLVRDPVVNAVLRDEARDLSPRTVRHRFLQATGLSKNHIQQIQRAQRAATLLEQGLSIADVVYRAGYADQPHLTRSLKQFVGHTPAQLLRPDKP